MKKFLLVCLVALSGCNDDGYLSQEEFENIVQGHALCYNQRSALECEWAEVYRNFGTSSISSYGGLLLADGSQIVVHERLVWKDGRLCSDSVIEGVQGMFSTFQREFRFDQSNLDILPRAVVNENIRILEAGAPDDICFAYERIEGRNLQFRQVTFIEGRLQPDSDDIQIIPLRHEQVTLYIP